MPLYDYLTPKLDFKHKFNHRQSFLYKRRLTVPTIRKFEPDHQYESNLESEVRFELESNLESSQVTTLNPKKTEIKLKKQQRDKKECRKKGNEAY